MSTSVKDKDRIVITSSASYWMGEKNSRSMKIQQVTSNVDKLLKAANFVPALAAQIIESDSLAPASFVDGMRSLAADARLVRNGVGLLNSAQSIPRVVYKCYELRAAWMTLSEKQNKVWKLEKDLNGGMSYKAVASSSPITMSEKVLGVTSSGLKVLEWIAFNICFIVCAPAQWLHRWFPQEMGPHAKTVGNQFSLFFFIKDVFLYSGAMTELARKKCEFERMHPLTVDLKRIAKKTTSLTSSECRDLDAYIRAENEYREKKYEAFFTTVKSVCDIALGIFNIARIQVNTWVVLILGFISSCVGLWEIYRDTAVGKIDKKEEMPEILKLDVSGLRNKVLSMEPKRLPRAFGASS